MGIHPSRPSRFEHVPLLTEMHQLPSHEHQPSTMAMTASAPYNPTPPLTTFPALTSAPLAPAPAAVDPHHANFTFYRSSVPPAGHCSPRSRRLSKLRRLMLCGASSERGGSGSRRRWSAGWRKGTRDELAYGEGTKGRRYRDDDDDDDDNVSVAESYASSLKSSASSAIGVRGRVML